MTGPDQWWSGSDLAAEGRWKRARFPKRHVDSFTSLEDLVQPRPGPFEVLKGFSPGDIVALIGRRGVGKTQMATCLARGWVWSGKTALYTTASGMYDAIREGYDGDRVSLGMYAAPDLLVIDEVDSGHGTAFEQTTLTDLMDRRYRDVKATILISNLEVQELLRNLGHSVTSRMAECGQIVICDWPSFRRPGKRPADP